jgi:hypothetical protein
MINNFIAFVNIHEESEDRLKRVGYHRQTECIFGTVTRMVSTKILWTFLTETQAASGPVPNSIDLDSASQGRWLKAYSKAESSA